MSASQGRNRGGHIGRASGGEHATMTSKVLLMEEDPAAIELLVSAAEMAVRLLPNAWRPCMHLASCPQQ